MAANRALFEEDEVFLFYVNTWQISASNHLLYDTVCACPYLLGMVPIPYLANTCVYSIRCMFAYQLHLVHVLNKQSLWYICVKVSGHIVLSAFVLIYGAVCIQCMLYRM